MIIDRRRYELFGKVIFEKVTIEAPFKIPNPMPEEACFLYMREGQIDYKTEYQSISVPADEAVLLKCGNYFSQMKSTNMSKHNQIVIVHFHPQILKKIYDIISETNDSKKQPNYCWFRKKESQILLSTVDLMIQLIFRQYFTKSLIVVHRLIV